MSDTPLKGRDLDRRVHALVMGFPYLVPSDYPVPAYSSDPAAMMRVVEVLRERFGVVEMSGIGNQWFCRVRGICEHGDAAGAETLPLAVARAALAAVKESPCP